VIASKTIIEDRHLNKKKGLRTEENGKTINNDIVNRIKVQLKGSNQSKI
jgi:hypothetical protein